MASQWSPETSTSSKWTVWHSFSGDEAWPSPARGFTHTRRLRQARRRAKLQGRRMQGPHVPVKDTDRLLREGDACLFWFLRWYLGLIQ